MPKFLVTVSDEEIESFINELRKDPNFIEGVDNPTPAEALEMASQIHISAKEVEENGVEN